MLQPSYTAHSVSPARRPRYSRDGERFRGSEEINK